MSQFEEAKTERSAAHRRRQRSARARKKVRSGDAAAGAARSSPSRTAGIFGVWRSSQHFCDGRSVPDAEAADLGAAIRWAQGIEAFGRRQRLIAQFTDAGQWMPVCYSVRGERLEITADQAKKYRDCRLGILPWSNDSYEPLTSRDHPSVTRHL